MNLNDGDDDEDQNGTPIIANAGQPTAEQLAAAAQLVPTPGAMPPAAAALAPQPNPYDGKNLDQMEDMAKSQFGDAASKILSPNTTNPFIAAKNKYAQQQPNPNVVPDQNINLGLNKNPVQQASMEQPVNPFKATEDAYRAQIDDLRQQGEYEKGAAAVLGKQGLEQNRLYNESAQKAQDLSTDFNKRYQDHAVERDNALKDMNNGHINPNRFHENMSVPQKIATAVGMLIAGAGSGLLHQQNPVIQWMQNQVDRDIDAQKQDINSVYAHYRAQMGSDKDAEAMTRSLLNQNYANKIAGTASKFAGPLAQQQAAGVASVFKQKADALTGQLAMSQAMAAQQNAMAQNPNVSPEQQALMLYQTGRIPKGEFPKVMQEIKDAQDTARNEPAILDAWDRGRGQFKAFGLREAPGNSEFMNLFEPVLKDIDGRVNDTSIANAKKLESAAFNLPSTNDTHRQTIQQMIEKKKAAPYASSFGIKMPQSNFKPYGK